MHVTKNGEKSSHKHVKDGVELKVYSWKPHQVETPLSTSSETAHETQCALSQHGGCFPKPRYTQNVRTQESSV